MCTGKQPHECNLKIASDPQFKVCYFKWPTIHRRLIQRDLVGYVCYTTRLVNTACDLDIQTRGFVGDIAALWIMFVGTQKLTYLHILSKMISFLLFFYLIGTGWFTDSKKYYHTFNFFSYPQNKTSSILTSRFRYTEYASLVFLVEILYRQQFSRKVDFNMRVYAEYYYITIAF